MASARSNTPRNTLRYSTPHGITVTRTASVVPYRGGLRKLLGELDTVRGAYLSSGYEFPGRYSRWDIAATRPPLELIARGKQVIFRPLNKRGEVLTSLLEPVLAPHPHWERFERTSSGELHGTLRAMPDFFPEELRSKQPSVFSILRALTEEFRHSEDDRLCFIGAFGYDLLFQFEPIPLRHPRGTHDDLHLYLADDIYYMDRKRERIERFEYEFSTPTLTTEGFARDADLVPAPARSFAGQIGAITSDQTPAQYMAKVDLVREGMRRGDYYEVVLRQTFSTPYSGLASELFTRMQRANPSPYEFLLQFGNEQLVGASPEMFVRVEGPRVETCPIAGTARRTGDAMTDAQNIRDLLNSAKEESELTMCTDVDRNDKSRVCEPGTVKVLGRRLIESYAGLFHTVDHVEGILQEGFDSLDAFLTHMWAVTLIGAPKRAAAQAIEQYESSPRGWYGGAIGMLKLNGDMNTGILIRTTYLRDGIASYPAGATLLYDSEPAAEEAETRLKATGFFRLLGPAPVAAHEPAMPTAGPKLLLVDHNDCFIHTLANYARQTGAQVSTYRTGFPLGLLRELRPDLLLISPGPGRPSDFGITELVHHAIALGVPIFGVCLGLQGIVEAFGGQLGILDYPVHGKPSAVHHQGEGVFEGLASPVTVGRYHSLYARRDTLPGCLQITAETETGVIMGVRHRTLPIEAVQFHPESLLSTAGNQGLALMRNAMKLAAGVAQVR